MSIPQQPFRLGATSAPTADGVEGATRGDVLYHGTKRALDLTGAVICLILAAPASGR